MKEIKFRLALQGMGIVNYDSADQAKILRNYSSYEPFSNVKFAKKVFYQDHYKIKISSDCLRHNIYLEDQIVSTSIPMYHPIILCNFVGSPVGLTRGYMFAGRSDGATYKRKSCLCITDAIQTNDAKSYMESYSKSGERSEISLFKRENVGNITYSSVGYISLDLLQFISLDDLFDRKALNADWANEGEAFDLVLKRNFGDYGTLGYFTPNSKLNTEKFGEWGILFNESTQKKLIKYLLNNLLKLNIRVSTGYAEVEKLELEVDGETITINSPEDIDNFIDGADLHTFFTQCDETDVLATRKILDSQLNASKEKRTKKKEEEKAKKEEYLAKKAAEEAKNTGEDESTGN